MKRKYVILLAIVLVIFAVSTGWYFYQQNQPKPDETFKKGIDNFLNKKQFALEQIAEGTKSKISAKATNDIDKKSYEVSSTLECKATYNNNPVTIKSTFRTINENDYIRLDSIEGTYNNGQTDFNLDTVMQNVKGKWYQNPQSNIGIKSLLDSGIAAYNSAVIAPTYDTKQIGDYIIANKVFSYKSYTLNNDIYEYKFVSDKNAYAEMLKTQFPNLSNQDVIVNNIFADKSTIESTIRFDENGNWIDEKLFSPNNCSVLFQIYIGEEAPDLTEEINSTATSKNPSDFTFEQVDNPKPLDQLSQDLVL